MEKERSPEAFVTGMNQMISAKMSAETGSNIISPVVKNSTINSMPITINVESVCRGSQEGESYDQLINCHKKILKEKLEYITDYTSTAGECVCLLQRFTDLWITDGKCNELHVEHEVTEAGSSSPRHGRATFKSMKHKDIFGPMHKQRQPRVVITRGIAGIGKTIYVKKFLLDWAMSKMHQEYDFVFVFPFCELNLISEESMSLVQLVQQHYPHMGQMVETYPNDSARSLFIFDGLDESRFSLEFENTPVCSDISKPVPLRSLLTNLIKGNLLHTASIWITTRPSTMHRIPSCYVDRVTEIQGFQDEEKEEYFRRKCQDSQLAEKIIALVKKQSSLWMMCYVPAFCWILATVLEHVLKTSCAEEFRGNTITEVYTNFLVVMVTYHHEHRGHGKEKIEKIFQLLQSDQGAILNLGKLAFQYLKSRTFVFYEEDFKCFNIDISSICGMFCREYYIKYSALSHRRVYSFVHSTVQEYFAALYIFATYHNEKRNLMIYSILGRIWEAFSKPTFFEICKSACSEVVQSHTGHLDLFLQFLCGLGRRRIQKCLQGLLTHVEEQKDDLQKTISYMKKLLQTDIPPERCINLFHCLNELNDKSVVREINESLHQGVLSSKKLSLADYSALAFVLKTSDMDRKEFHLSKYRISPDGLKRLLPVVKSFEKITLTGSIMDEEMIDSMSALLLASKNQIKELCLTNNTLGDTGLKKLAAALMSSSCRLETLLLCTNDLTEQCGKDLISILRTNRILKELDLKYNQLKDAGVKQLSVALQDSDCEIKSLGLWGNDITHCCCEELALALKTNKSLRSLDLGYNNIGDLGIKLLYVAIKDDGCKIEKLGLHQTGLTGDCCEDLSSILRTSQTLMALELGYNNLGDVGVQQLSAALKDPNCKLQTLGLYRNNLTSACCPDLADALTASSTLIELKLSSNYLQDLGVKPLFAALKNPHCRIRKINLKDTGLTAACSENILSALRVTRTLRELNLCRNKLGGSTIKLKRLAQQSYCKLQL
ncbi:NACHT, LRR and PYD domains-containing protein 3-like [Carcharodon carcharias]|uniref:NACHT, LRR and PYD domains-containing protein 3-like n=1 Tax=Carcharodon carcharias TaxID=13397 RepID=UPI001B7E9591|nr:NACHT, LRR and PYD domains-containing protein 3-like [Carcharodon carcharias]